MTEVDPISVSHLMDPALRHFLITAPVTEQKTEMTVQMRTPPYSDHWFIGLLKNKHQLNKTPRIPLNWLDVSAYHLFSFLFSLESFYRCCKSAFHVLPAVPVVSLSLCTAASLDKQGRSGSDLLTSYEIRQWWICYSNTIH